MSETQNTTDLTGKKPATENRGSNDSTFDFSKFQRNENSNAFGAQTFDRTYATPEIDQSLGEQEIPEPTFESQNISQEQVAQKITSAFSDSVPNAATMQPPPNSSASGLQNSSEQSTNKEQGSATTPPGNDPLLPPNPALTALPAEEAKVAAEQAVHLFFEAYEGLHAGMRWVASIPDEKLIEMELDGKVDAKMPVPDPEGEFIPLDQFVQEYNESVKEKIVVGVEFKEKVREPLIRICIKRGWGVTDEQYVLYMIGKDLTTKMAMVGMMRSSINKALRLYSKIWLHQKESGTLPSGNTVNTPQPGTNSNSGPNTTNAKNEEAEVIDAEILPVVHPALHSDEPMELPH